MDKFVGVKKRKINLHFTILQSSSFDLHLDSNVLQRVSNILIIKIKKLFSQLNYHLQFTNYLRL